MNRKHNTLKHEIATILVFIAFVGFFSVLAIMLCIIGTIWAFQLYFSSGWWAALLVMGGMLAIYAFTLSIALEFIERKSTK